MKRLLLLAGALCAVLGGCTGQPLDVAGGGSGSETVVGMLVDNTGTPVMGAAVRLYPYFELSQEDARRPLDSTLTNTRGEYAFENVSAGSYTIDAVKQTAGLRALISKVVVADSTLVRLPAHTMLPTASAGGWVEPQPPFDVSVVVAHSPYRASVDAQGNFFFADLPPGTHQLHAAVGDPGRAGDMAVIGSWTVECREGEHHALDSLRHLMHWSGSATLVIDDFDDCDEFNALGGIWWLQGDADLGGTTVLTPSQAPDLPDSPGRDGSGCALRFSYVFGDSTQRWYPRAGAGCNFGRLDSVRQAINLANARRLTFWAKGSAPNLWVTLESTLVPSGAHCEEVFGPLTGDTWQQYTVDLDSSIVKNAGVDEKESWSVLRRYVTRLTIRTLDTAGEGGSGEIRLDDLEIHFF